MAGHSKWANIQHRKGRSGAVEVLEDLDDVQHVYTNAEFADTVLASRAR